MKNLLLFSVLIFILGCKKDDNCTKEQFLGSWEGKYTCNFWGSGDAVVDITAGSGSTIVITEQTNANNPNFFDETSLKQDGCGAENKQTALGSGTTYTALLSSNENKLTLRYLVSALGATVEQCTYVLEPKM